MVSSYANKKDLIEELNTYGMFGIFTNCSMLTIHLSKETEAKIIELIKEDKGLKISKHLTYSDSRDIEKVEVKN